MQRVLQLSNYWRYLPQFRLVAESGSIRQAAALFHVSPSAVSRTIQLLESELGTALFKRHGRSLALTGPGKIFLESVRSAMRLLDDGYTATTSTSFSGEARVQVPEQLSGTVAWAMVRLKQENPNLETIISLPTKTSVDGALTTGEIDVGVVIEPSTSSSTTLVRLARLSSHVYCGPSHPLYGIKQVRRKQLSESQFVVHRTHTRTGDGWPLERDRTVLISDLPPLTALELCLNNSVLGVFFDVLTSSYLKQGLLWRLPIELIEDVTVFAARRRALVKNDLAASIIDAISQQFQL